MIKSRSLLLIFTGLLTLSNLIAQNTKTLELQSKYHVLDMSELSQIDLNAKNFVATPPPSGSIQSIAEFERMQGVVIAAPGYFGVPLSLIVEMSEDAIIYVLVEDQSTQNDVQTYFTNNGVNVSNVTYIQTPLNSYWTRDYSAWFIREDSVISIVDFPYNRPRPDDDEVPVVLSGFFGTNLYGMNMLHTGGNYMTDGMGKGVSTDLVSEENTNMTVTEIGTMALQYLGLEEYELSSDPLDEYIKHIDCWGKFLDVDKILIGEVPITDYRYADFEAIANYYANKQSSYGTNYQVFRTYSPDGQPYTNTLILNEKVFVPFVDGSGSTWNDTAKAVYEQAMPGYEVIGISETQWVNWYTTDALHCRTHGVADLGMLYLRHIPLNGILSYDPLGIEIEVEIKAYSDSSLIADSLLVYYMSQADTIYQTVQLTLDSADLYTANIPVQYGDTITYFISASDASGRSETHPFIGAADAHSFRVEQSIQAIAASGQEHQFELFPNPTNGVFYLKTDLELMEVFDMQGRMIYSEKLTGKNYQRFNFYDWEKGVYLVRVSNSHYVETVQLIVQ